MSDPAHRSGEVDALSAAVEAFYVRVLADDALAHYFANADMKLLQSHQRAFLAAALGGADAYVGRGMASAHAGLSISDGDFDRIVVHLIASLGELGFEAETTRSLGEALEPLRGEIVDG